MASKRNYSSIYRFRGTVTPTHNFSYTGKEMNMSLYDDINSYGQQALLIGQIIVPWYIP